MADSIAHLADNMVAIVCDVEVANLVEHDVGWYAEPDKYAVPYAVVMMPPGVTIRMTLLALSAKYLFPAASIAMPEEKGPAGPKLRHALLSVHEVAVVFAAGPLSPE